MSTEYSDRYEALGVPDPDPSMMCHGECDGTGFVPVSRDNTAEPLRSLWVEAERQFPTDDGWHFVRCPACNGTGLAA